MTAALLRIPRHWVVWTIVLFVLTFALGFLAKAVVALRFTSLDAAVNRAHSGLADAVVLALDKLDHPVVVVVVLAIVFVILFFVRGWRLALGTAVVTGLGWITTLVVKYAVSQPRPTTGDLSHPLHITPATLSYPSGHVVFAAALVAALVMVCHGRTSRTIVVVLGALFVLLVGWSRLYVGVHYATDVVGGILNGVAGALLFAGLWNIVVTRIFGARHAPVVA